MLYKDWLEEWLKNYVTPSVKAKTLHSYSEIAGKRLKPTFGEYEVSEVTPLMVQRYVTDLLQRGNLKNGAGLSSNTVNAIITVLQGSFQMAYTLGIAAEYQMQKVKRPKVKEKKTECFTVVEQKIIEQAVFRDKRDKMKGIVLCLYTGLRIGELLALEWSDVDFSKSEISVSKTCHDTRDADGRYCRMTDTPKTEHSIRIVPIPKQLMPMLREMKKKSNSNYVIADERGKPVSIRSYQRSYELLLKKNKIAHKGFHYLRHTFSTRASECSMDVKTLAEILGHENPTVTLKRYAHSFMEHKHEVINRLGKML